MTIVDSLRCDTSAIEVQCEIEYRTTGTTTTASLPTSIKCSNHSLANDKLNSTELIQYSHFMFVGLSYLSRQRQNTGVNQALSLRQVSSVTSCPRQCDTRQWSICASC